MKSNARIYNPEKVQAAFDKRIAYFRNTPKDTNNARIAAWSAFLSNDVFMDTPEDDVDKIAMLYYRPSLISGFDTERRWKLAFTAELHYINRKVTNSGVKFLFYTIVIAIVYGIYRLFK